MEATVYSELQKREKEDWWFVGRRKIIVSLLNRYLPRKKNLSIIDIGCGAGDVVTLLERFGKVVGVDSNRQIVTFNQKEGRNVVKGDITKLNFPPSSFDLVALLEVLEHLEDDLGGIKEACRVLKSKGVLLITVPAYPFLWGSHDIVAHHHRRYVKEELERKLTASGLKIIKISYMNTLLFPLISLIRLLKNAFNIGTGQSDFFKYPPFINWLLLQLFSLEATFLQKFNFPFGTSLLVLAKKS